MSWAVRAAGRLHKVTASYLIISQVVALSVVAADEGVTIRTDVGVPGGTIGSMVPVDEPVGSPTTGAAPRLADVREIGHAILVTRARERREIDEALQPTLAALAALEKALRDYASEHQSCVRLVSVGSNSPSRADAVAQHKACEQMLPARRNARRQAARQALAVLRERRERLLQHGPLIRRLGNPVARTPEGSADRPHAGVNPVVIEHIENELSAILDAPVSPGDDLTEITKVSGLLKRLEVARPPAEVYDPRPTVVTHPLVKRHGKGSAP